MYLALRISRTISLQATSLFSNVLGVQKTITIMFAYLSLPVLVNMLLVFGQRPSNSTEPYARSDPSHLVFKSFKLLYVREPRQDLHGLCSETLAQLLYLAPSIRYEAVELHETCS